MLVLAGLESLGAENRCGLPGAHKVKEPAFFHGKFGASLVIHCLERCRHRSEAGTGAYFIQCCLGIVSRRRARACTLKLCLGKAEQATECIPCHCNKDWGTFLK